MNWEWTLCQWLKHQQQAGIDIVTNGEQFRIHFVHGFLEEIEGIDWENLSSQRWLGELELLRLTSEQAPPVDLIKPASLNLSAQDVSISSACLTAGG